MLDKMREMSNSAGILLVFGAIIFVFIFFFGPQTAGIAVTTRDHLGGVGDVDVFSNVLDARLGRERMIAGERGSLDEAEMTRRRRTTLEDYLLMRYLAQRAEASGLRVSDDEVRCYIVNWNRRYAVNGVPICEQFPEDMADRYPNYEWGFYSRDNVLSETYRADVQSQFAMSLDEFEAYKAAELLARRYISLMEEALPVSGELVRQSTARRTESVDLEYIRLDPSTSSASDVTQIDIDRIVAEDPAAITAYYEANADDFAEEAQVEIRRIFLRRPPEGSSEAATALENYEQILARAQGGEDFEALAREFSELESERAEGGAMGPRTAANLATSLWDAANALEVGGVAGVEGASNWSIIKLESKTDARQRPIDEAREDIARQIAEERNTARAQELLLERGRAVLALAQSGMTLEEAAAAEAGVETEGSAEDEGGDEDTADVPAPTASPLRVQTTGPFARERAPESLASLGPQFANVRLPPAMPFDIPGIGESRELAQQAFELTADAPVLSELVEVDDAWFVIRLAERTDADPADTEVASNAWIEMQVELRKAFFGSDVIDTATEARLFRLQSSTERSPVLQAFLDQAIAEGAIRIKEREFIVDPVAQLPIE